VARITISSFLLLERVGAMPAQIESIFIGMVASAMHTSKSVSPCQGQQCHLSYLGMAYVVLSLLLTPKDEQIKEKEEKEVLIAMRAVYLHW